MKSLFIAMILSFIALPVHAAEENAPKLYAFETSAGMKVGAVFGELPSVESDDELLGAKAANSSHIEIHRMQEVDGIMQMRKVQSLPVEASKATLLDPMGYHLMLMGLSAPLKKGDHFVLTLTFKKSGDKEFTIPVLSRQDIRK